MLCNQIIPINNQQNKGRYFVAKGGYTMLLLARYLLGVVLVATNGPKFGSWKSP